ncbi:MAG: 50S ribosomal protein L24, partial [Candidatus Paceibacterota bacterium]
MKIRKGDKVRVMAGKDKGRTVKVERVYKKQKKVLLPEINIYKKHVKKSDKLPQGGVVELPRPLEVSK